MCTGSLSEANVREMYGSIMSERSESSKGLVRGSSVGGNVVKQKSIDVSDREKEREKEKDYKRNAACNNSMDSKWSYCIV